MARKKRPIEKQLKKQSTAIMVLQQREPYLLGVMVLLHLIPVWAFPYFTTCDGPTHTENAFLLDLFLKGKASEAMRAYYQLNPEPGANWLGSLFSALLINVFPVRVAEKLLASGYLIALPLSARYCLGAFPTRSYWVLLLLLPFTYNFLFNFGFFYFSYGLAIYLITIGYWWRHREQMNWKRGLVLAGLGLLMFFAHLYTMLAAGFTIAVASIGMTLLDGKQTLEQLKSAFFSRALISFLAFLPSLVMLGDFVLPRRKVGSNPGGSLEDLMLFLAYLEPLVSWGDEARWAKYLMLVLCLSACYQLYQLLSERARASREDLFLVVAVAFFVLYIYVPAEIASGGLLKERTALFVFFALILWLASKTYGASVRAAIEASAVTLSILLLSVNYSAYSRINSYLSEYISVADSIEPESTVLPLAFSRYVMPDGVRLSANVPPLLHAGAYITMQRRAVNLANFEARSHHFPLRYAQSRDPYVLIGRSIESTRPQLDILGYNANSGGSVDYVLIWGTPRDRQREHPAIQDILRQLQAEYQLVRVSQQRGMMQVWRRKSLRR